MQAFYTSWCQDDGMLVEEGTIFRFGENDFLLNAAKDQLHWLEQVAYGFDVHIEDISYDLAGLSLQGPQSRDVLRAFGINGIDHLPRFGILELELNGRWLRIDRAGFTGDLGYEIWTKPQDALWLWDRLFEVGRDHKIAPIGAQALEISRIEAGFILIDADYSGALHALRPSNRMSPYELGIGWTVSLNKQGYFVGKRALEEGEGAGPQPLCPDRDRDRGPQARARLLPLCRPAGQAGTRPHHLGRLVADAQEEHRLCPRADEVCEAGHPDVDRDLVREGAQDRALHGALLGRQPHVLRPTAQVGVAAAHTHSPSSSCVGTRIHEFAASAAQSCRTKLVDGRAKHRP